MKTTTIADAKNHLSHLIHQLENDEPIHLTRYGKPVAVMMSEAQYNKLIAPKKGLHSAIQNWRNSLSGSEEIGLSDDELKDLRKDSMGREFSWDE
ncbi:type II toxin-antitoxin system Phd/YefM family antitoxin [Methylotuvimicrobium sp. KM2]|jgi:prevent-host-death family protein|uniref:type II toxin-antitoxin system Phd/YefM family antitoxin n=1 Tax=Methylotuvimicrobium sp. KM2 TaxID=3133976 RepID=UPI003100F9FC